MAIAGWDIYPEGKVLMYPDRMMLEYIDHQDWLGNTMQECTVRNSRKKHLLKLQKYRYRGRNG